MKRLCKACLMSLRMFTTLPLPGGEWDESCAGLMPAALPLVGGVIGGLWYGLWRLLQLTTLPPLLQAAALTTAPVLLYGGIHLDGLMDCCDAIFSRAEPQRRRQILKDPHAGSFAVLGALVWLLWMFCCIASLLQAGAAPLPLVLLPLLSRSLCGLALLRLPPLAGTGYAALLRQGAGGWQSLWLLATALLCLAAGWLLGGVVLLGILLGAALAAVLAAWWVVRQLGGISGDGCGLLICLCELAGCILWATL